MFVFVVLFSLTCTAFGLANPAQLSTLGTSTQKGKTIAYLVGYYMFQKDSCFEVLKMVPEGAPIDSTDGVEKHSPVPASHCAISKDAQFVRAIYFEDADVCSKMYRETSRQNKKFFVFVRVPDAERELCSR